MAIQLILLSDKCRIMQRDAVLERVIAGASRIICFTGRTVTPPRLMETAVCVLLAFLGFGKVAVQGFEPPVSDCPVCS